jgi:hypothetical protein
MGTKVDAPPPRDYGKETRETLQAQVDLAPQLYAAESKYAPKYQDLQLQLLGRAAPQLMGIYERDIFPTLSRMEADSVARQRAADIQAVQDLGPQAQEAIRAANPQQAALLDSMTAQAQAGLDAGSSLTPDQARQIQQASRAAYAARGLSGSPSGAFDEVLASSFAGAQEQDRRNAVAMNAFNMQRSAYGDPFQQILGRPSGTFAAAQGYGAQAQGLNPGQLFNPESQYAADLIGGNQQSQLAARTASAANQTALIGAGMSAAGSAASAM